MKLFTKLFLFLIVFCILGGGAYYWWWHRVAAGVGQGIALFIQDQQRQGRVIELGTIVIDGFPGNVHFTIERSMMAAPRGGPAPFSYWRLDLPTLKGRLEVLRPDRLMIDGPGTYKLDSVARREPLNIRLTPSHFELVLSRFGSDGYPRKIDVDAEGIHGTIIETNGDFSIDHLAMTLEDLSLTTNDKSAPSMRWVGDLRDLKTAPVSDTTLIKDIDDMTWDIAGFERLPLTGGIREIDLWRQTGGYLSINKFHATTPELEIKMSGQLALDEALQPTGKLQGWMRGWNVLLQNLVANGAMSPSAGALANLGLRALARPPEEGGAPAVHAPLILSHRRIFLGPVNLGTTPPIRWE